MDEQKIRKIVQDEIEKAKTQAGYGVSLIPNHKHTGVDSPQIDFSTLIGTSPDISKSIGTAKGDIIGFTGSGVPVRVAVGTDGTALTSDSSASPGISWRDLWILKSLGTAKGDVVGFSASGTPGNLAVGTNGYALTADSTQSLGIKWQLPIQSALFNANSGLADTGVTTITTSPGFKPLMVVGISEGGSVSGSTTGRSTFFTGGPSSNGYCLTDGVGTSTSQIGSFVTASGVHQILIANFTATSFDVSYQRGAGEGNSGGTVYGVVIGY